MDNGWTRIYREHLHITDHAELRWRGYQLGLIQRANDGAYTAQVHNTPNGIFGVYNMPSGDHVGYVLVLANTIVEIFSVRMMPFDVWRAQEQPQFAFYVDWL